MLNKTSRRRVATTTCCVHTTYCSIPYTRTYNEYLVVVLGVVFRSTCTWSKATSFLSRAAYIPAARSLICSSVKFGGTSVTYGWVVSLLRSRQPRRAPGYLFLVLPSMMMIVVVVHKSCRVSLEEGGGGADTRLNFFGGVHFVQCVWRGGRCGVGNVSTCIIHPSYIYNTEYIFRVF